MFEIKRKRDKLNTPPQNGSWHLFPSGSTNITITGGTDLLLQTIELDDLAPATDN